MSRSALAERRGLPPAGVSAPADRRFRRSMLGPDRRRVGRTLIRALIWLVAGAAGAASAVWLVDRVGRTPMLAIQHIVVGGNSRLSTGAVESLVDGLRGENIFHVDFDEYRRRLLDSPWVADVTLRRILPSTVDVQIVERAPLAIARLGQQLFLVDDTGVVVDEYGAQYGDLDLPIVDGLLSSPSSTGPLVERDRVRLTAALIAALAARPDLGRRLSQIDVSRAHDAVVLIDDDPAWLHLGEARFLERLETYLELAPTFGERFLEVDAVDLRFDNRIFVHSRGRVDQTIPAGAAGRARTGATSGRRAGE